MPVIERAVLDEKEMAVADFLRQIRWPADDHLLLILPLPIIKQWLYGLDPKVAIVITCDPDFKKILAYKQSQHWFGKFVDRLTRRVRGIDF